MRPNQANSSRRRPAEGVASLSLPPAYPSDAGAAPARPAPSGHAPAPAPSGAAEGYLQIGLVAAPRGVRGELRLVGAQDTVDAGSLHQVYLGDALIPFEVLGARRHGGQLLLTLAGISDRDAAEEWRGARVYVARGDATPLEQDEYYCSQIVGLTAVTVEGEVLGEVTGILATGANDVYVVSGGRVELLLPAIKDVVVRIALDEGKMVVRLLDGLR